jgi:hypothetical protein
MNDAKFITLPWRRGSYVAVRGAGATASHFPAIRQECA